MSKETLSRSFPNLVALGLVSYVGRPVTDDDFNKRHTLSPEKIAEMKAKRSARQKLYYERRKITA